LTTADSEALDTNANFSFMGNGHGHLQAWGKGALDLTWKCLQCFCALVSN